MSVMSTKTFGSTDGWRNLQQIQWRSSSSTHKKKKQLMNLKLVHTWRAWVNHYTSLDWAKIYLLRSLFWLSARFHLLIATYALTVVKTFTSWVRSCLPWCPWDSTLSWGPGLTRESTLMLSQYSCANPMGFNLEWNSHSNACI